eukprot:3964441-Prymnesium_polylepis.2
MRWWWRRRRRRRHCTKGLARIAVVDVVARADDTSAQHDGERTSHTQCLPGAKQPGWHAAGRQERRGRILHGRGRVPEQQSHAADQQQPNGLFLQAVEDVDEERLQGRAKKFHLLRAMQS